MNDRADDLLPGLEPPTARTAPPSLRLRISQLAAEHAVASPTHPGNGRAVRSTIATVAAASAIALGGYGATRLSDSHSTSLSPAKAPTLHYRALTAAQIKRERKSCIPKQILGGPAAWKTTYAQRLPVIGTGTSMDVIFASFGGESVSCKNGKLASMYPISTYHDKGTQKFARPRPTSKNPAVVTEPLSFGFGSVIKQFPISIGAEVTRQVVAGRVRITDPHGVVGPWFKVPVRQGMALTALRVPSETRRVEFQAVDKNGHPVTMIEGNQRTTTRTYAIDVRSEVRSLEETAKDATTQPRQHK